MMTLVNRQDNLWCYLLPPQRELIKDCEKLIADAREHPKGLTDYSYIVFPIAKMYEGFLKKLLLDLGVIDSSQYRSDHLRIGKVLNPNLPVHLKIESVYEKLCHHLASEKIGDDLWQAWKRGRNLLFHYFPGHLQRIKLTEAEETVRFVLAVMAGAVRHAGNKLEARD